MTRVRRVRYQPPMAAALAPEGTRFYRLARALGSPLLRLYLRLRVEGAGNLPPGAGAIVAANHQSYLDPLVIAATCPRPVAFVMLRRHFQMPGIGWFSRSAGSFPIDEGRIGSGAFRRALAVLGAGGVLGVFPEGRISPDGRLGAAKPGVARIALRAGAPIVPVGISGTRRSYPKGRLLPRPAAVVVRYGTPILPEAVPVDAPGGRDAALAALVMERIGALCDAP